MRFKVLLLAMGCGMFALNFAGISFAQAKVKSAPQAAEQTQGVQVNLYDQPETSAKIIASFAPTHSLIPILHKGAWVKVGDPKNGDVGWINLKQYRKAYNDFYKPNVQAVFIRHEDDKRGKPVVNIIAYSNGKKLDAKQAQALYKQMQTQQRHELRAMHRFNAQMDHFFEREHEFFAHDFPEFIHSDFMPPLLMRPVIVVTQPELPASKASTTKAVVEKSVAKKKS